MKVKEPEISYNKVGEDIKNTYSSDYLFRFRLTMGRIGESLVQELFHMEGYQTYKYGMENIYQHLYHQIKEENSTTARSIRCSPDLVVFNPKKDRTNFIEVRVCMSNYFKFDQKWNDYPSKFPGGFFVIVTPLHFYLVSFEEMKERRRLVFEKSDDVKLTENNIFDFRNKSIGNFEQFASVYFGPSFREAHKKIGMELR